MQRRLTTILAADISGFSRLVGNDEEATLAAQRLHRTELIDPLLEKFGGRVANTAGDSLLIEFPSAVEAVRWATSIQEGMATRNAAIPEDRQIRYRIGINIGDVILADGGDLLGDGVNIAARLEALSPPGGIILSRTARDQVRDRLALDLADLGEVSVKNISRPVRAFQVLRDGETPLRLPKTPRRYSIGALAAVAVIAAVIGGGLYWYQANIAFEPPPSAAPQPSDKPSIAVLPFTNVGDDKTQEYFADGLTDDLILDLSKLSGLFVIARNSVFTFKGRAVRIEDVAKELGVHFVVEGSVRRFGDQVRVNAQLVDGQTGHHVWAQRYDRKTTDLFAVQDDLVTRIVSSLAVQLTQTEETQLAPRTAPEFKAYDLYLQARDGYFSRDQTRMRESLNRYIEAWTIDPEFARAYAGYARLAADIWRLSALRGISGATLRRSAELAARKAIAMDPALGDTYSVLALMSMVDKNHEEAITLARRAVQLDPNSADAHTTLSIVLSYAGRPEEALEASKTSMRLNPRPAPYHLIYYGFALYLNQKYDEAITVLEPIAETRDRGLGDAPREILAMAYAMTGRVEEARAAIDAMKLEEPFLNLAYYRVVYDHQAPEDALDRRLEALRRAGLPEWPLGFQGEPGEQLADSALDSLITSTTWSGQDDGRRGPFVQEFGADGGTVYATRNGILNGQAFVRGDELCERYEGFVLSRELCGPVFRVPGGAGETLHEFAYVNPTTVRYFSLTD